MNKLQLCGMCMLLAGVVICCLGTGIALSLVPEDEYASGMVSSETESKLNAYTNTFSCLVFIGGSLSIAGAFMQLSRQKIKEKADG